MDKEMKVKIDEFLKAKGMRELNLDEMDKVSGGTDFDENDVCPVCGSRQISLILYARIPTTNRR